MRFAIIISMALSLFWPHAALAQPKDAALVLSVYPGVESILAGKTANLVPKMAVPIKATVKSNATGHSQLIFPDDATITITPDTEVQLADFVDQPSDENIVLDMMVGTMRVITGEASKRNTAAFTVNTPHATIGVRGTMVTISVSGDMTRIYLSETSGKGVTVRNKYNGRVLDMRSPGLLITVGPEIFQEKKATMQEVAAFRAVFRHPAGQPTRVTAGAENNPRRLSAPGTLPFTSGLTVAQLDEANRMQQVAYATPHNPPSNPGSVGKPVTPANPPDTPPTPPASPGNQPVTPPAAEPGIPATPANPPDAPQIPPVIDPGNQPSTPPATGPTTPVTPENPPVTPIEPTQPDVPPVEPDVPVTPPLDPGVTPLPPDTPVNPDAYKVTLPDLAGNFTGNGTFSFYAVNDPTAPYGNSRTGSISFTVPRSYVSLQNDIYTINLTDVKVPGYQNGGYVPQPLSGHNLQVNVNRQSGAITQVPGQTVTTGPDEIRALLMRGNFSDNQKGILDTLHFTAGTGARGQALRGRNQGSINVTKQ